MSTKRSGTFSRDSDDDDDEDEDEDEDEDDDEDDDDDDDDNVQWLISKCNLVISNINMYTYLKNGATYQPAKNDSLLFQPRAHHGTPCLEPPRLKCPGVVFFP
jgi:hypothetical protein